MDFLTFLLPLLLAPFLANSFCPITNCTSTNSPSIRFPFGLPRQPENCSFPGFDLHCTTQGSTALNLPHYGEFLVRDISYSAQKIRIYDPKNCLPKKLLHGLDLSKSKFQADLYLNYTFLSCPRNVTDARVSFIDCLSNETRSVMATSLDEFAARMVKKSCQVMKSLAVPVSWPQNKEFSSSLSDDIWLSWDEPDCKDCEDRGGFCGFQGNGQLQIGCFYDSSASGNPDPTRGNTKGLKVFRIIAFTIAIPSILCAMAVGILLCILDRRDNGASWLSNRAARARARTEPVEGPIGLDQTTIDSYTKVILGESRRVPGPNDGSCPICLSEFGVKETLRCIPECQHSFHADCIDEWLRLNGTCPLCRSSPAHHIQLQNVT